MPFFSKIFLHPVAIIAPAVVLCFTKINARGFWGVNTPESGLWHPGRKGLNLTGRAGEKVGPSGRVWQSGRCEGKSLRAELEDGRWTRAAAETGNCLWLLLLALFLGHCFDSELGRRTIQAGIF